MTTAQHMTESKVVENMLDKAVQLASIHRKTHELAQRKPKGQIFTPKSIAEFMASWVDLTDDQIVLLDPGAGTGILIAALCDQIIRNAGASHQIIVDAYENDPNIISKLSSTLQSCEHRLQEHGHQMQYNVIEEDFILKNAPLFQSSLEPAQFHQWQQTSPGYTTVIANPPYYKLNKESPQARAMHQLVYGQPNIYALFMALALAVMAEGGQIICIAPRSFCSGLYYRQFREWFLPRTKLERMHLFESRKDVFNEDGVLQESVIIKGRKSASNDVCMDGQVTVSLSEDKTFTGLRELQIPYNDVVHRTAKDMLIRLPSSQRDQRLVGIVDEWSHTLDDLHLGISTGPVVPFRATEYLLREYDSSEEVAPLLWMHNLNGWTPHWPETMNGKQQALRVNEETKKILLPVGNYVLLKRVTSKEQKRRLYAGVLKASDFQEYGFVGIENHLNYIYRSNGILSEDEAYGVTALLNSSLFDVYFRALSGNTQVNASTIRTMPFPPIEVICQIGHQVQLSQPAIGDELDQLLAGILDLHLL